MKKKRVLDSFALLAYLNREEGFQKVKNALRDAHKSGGAVLVNEINVGETYYILCRKRSREKAGFFLDTVLEGLPVVVVPNSFEDVIRAARIKSEHPLSFADCFAACTALREHAAVMTGDPEFRHVEHLVKIDWL